MTFTELSTWARDLLDDPSASTDDDVHSVLVEITASADEAVWRTSPIQSRVTDGLLG